MSTQGLGLTPPILREPTSLPGRWRWCDRPWLCDARKSKRASHIDPPASSYVIMRRACPYRGENPGPGKDALRELDHWPGIREQPGSFSTVTRPASGAVMSPVPPKRKLQSEYWHLLR
jgi:hypothetical protein